MAAPATTNQGIWAFVVSGGMAMYPLVLCSLISWAVILERLLSYRRLSKSLESFHLEAVNCLLRHDLEGLKALCGRHPGLPTSKLISIALERLNAKDAKLRAHWLQAVQRKRMLLNQDMRKNLWLLGTIGSSAPFIGLFGTVVGILRSFQDMSKAGSGGFANVASGISESLVATASGIVVAVISVMAYNAFQTHWSSLVLRVRIHSEELAEMIGELVDRTPPGA
jgi:biopolymer transport protein ExbB